MPDTDTRSWQSHVAELTAERHRAEAAAAVIKRKGDTGDVTAAEIAYGDGRAEAEAVIAALTIALEQGDVPDDVTDIETHMTQAVAARETLARRASELAAGERGIGLDLLAEALPTLLSAIGALWKRRADQDAATRATIAARLDAARWPPFADIRSQ